jgi:hypothetical protein
MSEPSREHVEAVGEAMAPKPFAYYRGAYRHDPDAVVSYLKRAERILTSTDPAVLDAMQDALVRAGRLHLQVLRQRCSCGVANTFGHVMADEHHALPDKGRFVTEWQEVEP